MFCCCEGFFKFVGIIVVASLLLRFLLWVFNTFVYSSYFKIGAFVGKDKWGVVTGCTAGIGKGFAIELARRKTNVILMSRNPEKLDKLAAEIEKKYKVETKIVVCDFSKMDITDALDELNVFIRDRKVTCLVNNVGINTKTPDFFMNHTNEQLEDFLVVNCLSALKMSKVVIPRMDTLKRGLIINLSSIMSQLPTPMNSVYAGTKSFIKGWGEAMSEEVRGRGIKVMNIVPMYVKSDMTGFRRTTMKVPSGEKYARVTFNRVGGWFDEITVNPYFYHCAEVWVYSVVPQWFRLKMMFGVMKGIKKAMLRKFERERLKREGGN